MSEDEQGDDGPGEGGMHRRGTDPEVLKQSIDGLKESVTALQENKWDNGKKSWAKVLTPAILAFIGALVLYGEDRGKMHRALELSQENKEQVLSMQSRMDLVLYRLDELTEEFDEMEGSDGSSP